MRQELAGGLIVASRTGAVGHVLFNRPEKRNAMSLAMWQGLTDALAQLAADDAVRVVVLSGAGDRAFVSGADISEFESQRASEAAIADYNRVSEGADRALWAFPKPTIAMIRGFCVGGGMGLALACDMRIAAEDARLGITAARMGLGYGVEGIRKLVDLVGPSVAAEVMFTASLFPAAEARAMGLVNRVVPVEALAATVDELAGRIAGNAPLTVTAAKAAIRPGSDVAAVEALVKACYDSADYAEGRRAFMEKRAPVFRGV